MTIDKEVLRTLYKIAQNQQRILRKLAQDQSMTINLNVGVIQNIVDKMAGAGSAQVQSASLRSATDETKTLMMSVQVLNKDAFDRARGNIELVLKRQNILVDDQGNRHTAQSVSINVF